MDNEKIVCFDRCNGGDANWALMANQWQNNPFAYMMILGMMRFMYGDNWQNQYAGNAEMQSRFNQLSNQMSDNHNTDILADFAKGNYARIGELANNLNVDLRDTLNPEVKEKKLLDQRMTKLESNMSDMKDMFKQFMEKFN